MHDDLRNLPSVGALLDALGELGLGVAHVVARRAAREAIDEARSARQKGTAMTFEAILQRATSLSQRRTDSSLHPVINATGTILHTNLGRAPLSAAAVEAMAAIAGGYSNLEFDVATGRRGSRHDHARELIRQVTGAEDAIVLNNNAAAVFASMSTLAAGRGLIISRGQAVEIGGGFRIPEMIAQSGAKVVEVGTTNRTYLRDYENAIDHETTAILRVHRSNFRMTGFISEPAITELAELAHAHGLIFVDDLGSGALVETERVGLPHEPMVQESLNSGADLVLFSGDKLLGGPQCGIVAGRADLVERIRRHPLARVLRVDKMTLAALEATLGAYANDTYLEELPLWQMLGASLERQRDRAEGFVQAAGSGMVLASRTLVGGGSLPDEGIPTWVASIECEAATRVAAALRQRTPAIVCRIEHDRLVLDPRTVNERDDETVADALRVVLRPNQETK